MSICNKSKDIVKQNWKWEIATAFAQPNEKQNSEVNDQPLT